MSTDPKKYAPPPGVEFSPRLLKDLYVERFGKDAVKALEQEFQVPRLDKNGKPKEDETVLDEAAFYAEIRKTLVSLQPVDDAELRTLGVDRSRRIKDLLVTTGQVLDTRVFLLDVDTAGEPHDGLVRVELTLSD